MITYIYQKDSTIWAFEGRPELDYPKHFTDKHNENRRKYWEREMEHARESALPVVNVTEVAYMEKGRWRRLGGPWMEPNENVALPGWGLERHYQIKYNDSKYWRSVDICRYQHAKIYNEDQREAYRLVRSEPDGIEMNHAVVDEFTKPIPIKLTFKSGSLWYGEYEVVNPDKITRK